MKYQLTDRCSMIRERVVEKHGDSGYAIGQKFYHYIKGYYSLPMEKRNNFLLPAAALASVIRNFEPHISDEESIVGYNYSDGIPASANEEICHETLKRYSNDEENRKSLMDYINYGDLNEAQKKEFATLVANASDPYRYPYHPYEKSIELDSSEQQLVDEWAVLARCVTHSHTILAYEAVLKYGYRGLLEKVREARSTKAELTREQAYFYEALEMVCEACCGIGKKYAALAVKMQQNGNNARREELLEIQKICERVPEYPARNFREAVQSLWFAHIINTWEDGINANSLGRLDQILYPWYRKDMDSGILTKENAFELICLLWLKLYRSYDVQQATVGGCDENGENAVNDLSYLMLDATEALDFVRCISVRFSQKTPKEFMRRALEVVGHVQKGIPFFFNDDVMIQSLIRRGIALKDARDYGAIGCVETCIPGKANPHAVSARCNVLKAIEYTLNNGKSMMNTEYSPGVQTGNPESFITFEALKQAVFTQIKRMVEVACKISNAAILAAAEKYPLAYKSLLTEGCLEAGLDFNAGGPKYNYYQFNVCGIPNLADSLAAIEKLVYTEKRYTIKELIDQLKNNFPDEAVRLDFVNKAPKYGNDFPEVDRLAAEIMEYTCKCIEAVPSVIGEGFHPQPFTFVWMVDHGKRTAATPDGRRSGEIFAYSMSPMQGRDFNGFTALLNSLSCLPTELAPGTTSTIVEVDPYLFTDRNLDYFVDLLLASGKKGLQNIQFNIVDRDMLLDAKMHPEKHKNLAVRVSGFSQKFTLLDETIQDHIIQRTKHRTM